ncbi:Six-hairpin glycosidase-like protein [Penicillium riverlandense]|uniref:Six-hairpin glycosidase-like protein n=1 Tax=Penicillium riverlandense TaxID=1903569 RepID=UPI002547517C|nr:Six-hairpin glycosidase-like protein [Penicillium riverlandense]KAJ5832921.1 Six-hairpin glycosidase-like protein [Penicillium riverlandense]
MWTLGSVLTSVLFARASLAGRSCWRDTDCTGPTKAAFSGVWDSYIYAPRSRTVSPSAVVSFANGESLKYSDNIELSGNGSLAVLDFGIEVGGIVHLSWKSSTAGQLGLAFTEGKNWIGKASDNSHSGSPDGAIYANLTHGSGTYVMPDEVMRGGFRYLTLFLVGDGTVTVSNIDLELSFQPTWSNLRAYQGYFYSSDDELNKIWYSGAYTLQTNAVPANTGQWNPSYPNYPWALNGVLGNGSTILVDGAKRDRAVWPGDMGVAVPSNFVSIGDMLSTKNSLQTMYDHQNSDGSFPESGPPYLQQNSDTYHMWTMIGTYNYILYTYDLTWLRTVWPKYKAAFDYIYAKVDSSGLLYSTGTKDWGRLITGGNLTEANMILYKTLITGSSLAAWMGDNVLSDTCLERATNLQEAINAHCWDDAVGAYRDSATSTTVIPQDANSMAVVFNFTNDNQTQFISSHLTQNWNSIGAVSPELTNNVVSFISSIEVNAHFVAGQSLRALDLIRRSWGWYLNNPNGTQSTVIEGYLPDGTFGYRYNRGYKDASYTSHSHGWSSGPTNALTEHVLGLSIMSPLGKTWSLQPQFGDLKFVEGGFQTDLGKFRARWALKPRGYIVTVNAPIGTSGVVVLPALSRPGIILVNGIKTKYDTEAGGWSFSLRGGQHTIVVNAK